MAHLKGANYDLSLDVHNHLLRSRHNRCTNQMLRFKTLISMWVRIHISTIKDDPEDDGEQTNSYVANKAIPIDQLDL